MRRAIIFGITGQDGQFLANRLLDEGFIVLGVSRYSSPERVFQIERLNNSEQLIIAALNLLNEGDLKTMLRDFMPDLIFNLSGITSVAKSFMSPVETFASIAVATQNILEAIKSLHKEIHYLNAGSSECFGESLPNRSHTEDSIYKPRSPYATAKVAALHLTDMYRSCYGLKAYSAILSNHESILRKNSFVTKKVVSTLKKIDNGIETRLTLGNLNVTRDFGWAPDYVEAMLMIVESNIPDNYIVCTGHSNTLRSFVQKSWDFYGLDMSKYVEIDNSLYRPNEPKEIALCPEKINRVIGWKATKTFDEVVQKLCSNSLF